jgi:hypothetical protein
MKTSVIINLWNVLVENDRLLLFFICLSTLIFIVCALMAIILLMLIMMNYSNAQLIKNPLNKDTIAYQMRDACNINLTRVSSNYPYGVIMWLLFINLIIIIIAVGYTFTGKGSDGKERVENNKKLFGSNIWFGALVLILFAGVSVLMFGICYLFFSKTKKSINHANVNVAKFNSLVSSSMYSTDTEILKILRSLPTSTIDITNKIDSVLQLYVSKLKKTSPKQLEKDLSELFFTFNLYQHYIKMGINQNNTAVSNALMSVFNSTNILKYTIGKSEDAKEDSEENGENIKSSVFTDVDSSSWPAADYLISKYTFIKDYSNNYIQLIQNSDYYTGKFQEIATPQLLLKAANNTSNNSISASQLANSFNLNASLNSFISMAVWIAIITILPFILIWIILSGTAEGSMELLLQKEFDTNVDKTISNSKTRLYELQSTLASLERQIKKDNKPEESESDSENLKDDFSQLNKITSEVLDITNKNIRNIKSIITPVIEEAIKQKQEATKQEADATKPKATKPKEPTKQEKHAIKPNDSEEFTSLDQEQKGGADELVINKKKNIDVNIRLTRDSIDFTDSIIKNIQTINNTIINKNINYNDITNIVKDINDYIKEYNELKSVFNDIISQYDKNNSNIIKQENQSQQS